MVSIQSTVIALYKENKEISLDDLREMFPNYKDSTLSNALSVARNSILGTIDDKIIFTKIDEEEVEKVILSLLNKRVDTANVRLMVDFLKIKRMSSDMDVDLDVSKFLKRVKDADS